jgi:MFS family permease
MLIMAPLGFSFAVATVAGQTVINDLVPLHLQGRVQSTQAAMAGLASSVPVLAAGAMADLVGVNAVIAVVAALIGIAAVMNLRGRRERAAPALDVVGRID